ncbi:hypothetical protein HF313_10995 [Massilia atriviolacea]|uniref:Uncharacterized protein n=1 Tax=Massilia atriviolacea TaxID=2495579 RepID=A0A430HID3_9BURK|nr:hypothetical protein [Massilia atriviolacea]RSZ57276.1 hypothetical protein EJB06_19115 [Massilia atriviolacea]
MADAHPDSYITCVIADTGDQALFVTHLYCEGGDPSISRIMMIRDRTWYHVEDIDTPVYAFLARRAGAGALGDICALGRSGRLRMRTRGQLPREAALTPKAGYLACMNEVDGVLYAAGTQNQLYRYSDEEGRWHEQDAGLYAPLDGQVERMLLAIDGFAHDDLYAVGWNGALWHWDGASWSALASPTTAQLNAVLCGGDGQVYLAGSCGRLFRGARADGWTVAGTAAGGAAVFNDMAWFQGRLYLAGGATLFVYDGATLAPCPIALDGRKTFNRLSACGDALWCTGNESVLVFDGATWVRHGMPE